MTNALRMAVYTPDRFELLQQTVRRWNRPDGLGDRAIVDHYYAGSPLCRMHLLLDGDGQVAGMIGVERLRFLAGDEAIELGIATNYHSFTRGVGGFLYMQWFRDTPYGLVFGGSPDTQRILHGRNWRFHHPPVWILNRPCAAPAGETGWRAAAKWVARHVACSPIPRYARRLERAAAALEIREEGGYDDDWQVRRSPFALRLAPSLEHLRWRFATTLGLVRYRPFRILRGSATVGYVIVNDGPRQLSVAHLDGDDPATLAHGVLLALLQVAAGDRRPRSAVAVAGHPEMQRIYRAFGFRRARVSPPFAVGGGTPPLQLPADTSSWLVGYDLGDIGLRPPYWADAGRAPAAGTRVR